MAKYTFLVPAYKSFFFREAIESMLNQTFQNFEILVSDDCSPEDIKSMVDSYDDKRIKYRRNEHNIGALKLTDHWNLLVNMTNSEYLIMASDDDVYEPTFLENIDKLSINYPNASLIKARVRIIDLKGETFREEYICDEFIDKIRALRDTSGNCIANMVFKTKDLKKKGGFIYFPYAMGSDTFTALKLSENGVANTSEILFNYRNSAYQISHYSKIKEIDRVKLQGVLAYHEWSKCFIENLQYEHNLLNDQIIREYSEHRKSDLVAMTYAYFGALSFTAIISHFKKLKSLGCFHRKLEEIQYFLNYPIAHKSYK